MSNIDEIKERIAKLLNLARGKGASEAEAGTAMQFAMRLMLQHGLSEAEFAEGKEHTAKVEGGKSSEADNRWEQWIAMAAGKLVGAKPLFGKSRAGVTFRYYGRAEYIEAAEMLHVFLCEQVERLYKINLTPGLTKSARAEYRRTFKEACALRVFHRAEALVKEMMANDQTAALAIGKPTVGGALVVQGHFDKLNKEVEQFFASMGGVRTNNRAVSIKSGSGSWDGHRAGDQVKLNRAIG